MEEEKTEVKTQIGENTINVHPKVKEFFGELLLEILFKVTKTKKGK